jgi:hypothetical protein
MGLSATRARAVLPVLLVGACLTALAGCGTDPATVVRHRLGPATDTTAQRDAHGRDNDTGTRLRPWRSRRSLLRAATIDTAGPRRFEMRVDATFDAGAARAASAPQLAGVTSLHIAMRGFRTADGSTAVRGTAGAGPLHQALRARIVDDRLYVLRGGRWFDMGMAGGITLDVGRELFVHPQLVRVTGGRRFSDGHVEVSGTVGRRALAAHAATEPTGLVSTALQHTTGLRFIATVEDGHLTADRFDVGVDIPVVGTGVDLGSFTLRFTEHYSKLEDTRPVAAPANARRARSLAELLLTPAG